MQTFGTVLAFAYNACPDMEFDEIVGAIHADLRTGIGHCATPAWDCDDIALIDQDGLQLVLGWLPPDHDADPWYLVAAIGHAEAGQAPCTDAIARIAAQLSQTVGTAPAMTAAAHQPVGAAFIDLLFDMLRQGKTNSDIASLQVPALPAPAQAESKAAERFEPIEDMQWDFSFADNDIGNIQQGDVDMSEYQAVEWLSERAEPTHTLRLTVHALAMSLMLYAPPIGVFLFVYALLRDALPMTT